MSIYAKYASGIKRVWTPSEKRICGMFFAVSPLLPKVCNYMREGDLKLLARLQTQDNCTYPSVCWLQPDTDEARKTGCLTNYSPYFIYIALTLTASIKQLQFLPQAGICFFQQVPLQFCSSTTFNSVATPALIPRRISSGIKDILFWWCLLIDGWERHKEDCPWQAQFGTRRVLY